MKKRTRFISFLLMLLMIVPMIPFSALNIFASTDEEAADATMDAINSAVPSSMKMGETQTIENDGYIGIPVQLTVYYDSTKGAAKPGFGKSDDIMTSTPIIIYVVNTYATRTGTDSDADIVMDFLTKGYAVVVLDYRYNSKAVSPALDWSVQGLIKPISRGEYFADKTIFPTEADENKSAAITSGWAGRYYNTVVVPSGHTVSFNHVFFEYDKHAVSGTLENIVNVWNNDFRGCMEKMGNIIVKWTYDDGSGNPIRKKTQNAIHDGSEPVWYADAEGTVVDNENGQYINVKHTLAETIYDCVQADGTPIDLSLYMHIVYPTNPEEAVPVMAMSNSDGHLAAGLQNGERPHVNGFLFNGYAISIYDHIYVPMARFDHYDYFDGEIQGGVTNVNNSYTLMRYNAHQFHTSAMRYIRYLTLSQSDEYKFKTDSIGVVGNSKGAPMTILCDPDLQSDNNVSVGMNGITTEAELNAYIDTKINSRTNDWDFPDHHGETRYQSGQTADQEQQGITIYGGELQPWLSYNGTEITSGANFVYANCGANQMMVREGYAPYVITAHLNDDSGYTAQNQMINLARQFDLPVLYFESNQGHTLVGEQDARYADVNPYNSFKDYAHFVLNNGAVKFIYSDTVNGTVNVSTTDNITLHFAGSVSLSEIQKVVISDGTAAQGTWVSSLGQTEWTFIPSAPLNSASKYTVTIPATVVGTNGVAIDKAYSFSFTTKGEAVCNVSGGVATVTSTAGTYVSFTAPNMADYAGVNANKFTLRVKIANEAANVLNVYAVSSTADTSTANLAGTANLKGDGFYDIDVSDYMQTVAAGSEVYFLIKASKATGETAIASRNFDTYIGADIPGAIKDKGDLSKILVRIDENGNEVATGGTTVYKAVKALSTNPGNLSYYRNEWEMPFRDWNLVKSTNINDSDYGRKIVIKVRLYDTVSRTIMMKVAANGEVGLSNRADKLCDTDAAIISYTTKAGEWQELELVYTVYDTEYGSAAYSRRQFIMLMTSDGDNESPIYFDYITSTEITTDVEIASCSLVLANEGDVAYKQPTDTVNAFDVNGTRYASFADAYTACTDSEFNVTLLKNYTFTDADVKDLSKFASVTIDLNGYKLTAANTSKAPLYVALSNSNTVSITVQNGAILVDKTAIVAYEAVNASATGKKINVSFNDVYVGLAEGASTKQVVSENTIANNTELVLTAVSRITFTDCDIDIDQSKHTNSYFSVFAGGNSALDVISTVIGGEIKVASLTKTTISEKMSTLVLGKNTAEQFPTLMLGTSATLASTSFRHENGVGDYVAGAEADGYVSYAFEVDPNAGKYGEIPAEYADIDTYPFVIFDGERNFIGGYAALMDGSTGAIDVLKNKSGEYFILMRKDMSLAYFSNRWNLSLTVPEVNIDLNGYTLSVAYDIPLFGGYSKGDNKVVNFTVMNGTVEATNTALIITGDDGKDKTFNYTFDNVTFKVKSGAKPATLFAQTKAADFTRAVVTNITFNDCVFDLSNVTAATTLFELGNSSGTGSLTGKIRINGGSIISGTLDYITLSKQNSEGATLTFGLGNDGKYTTLTVNNGVTPGWSITSHDNKKMEFANGIVGTTTTTYELRPVQLVETKYGSIPESAANLTWIVFSGGEYKGGYDSYNFALALAREILTADSTAGVQLLLTKDYNNTDEAYGYLLSVAGDLTIDLQTYTFKCTNSFLRACARSNGTLNINIIGGTVEVPSGSTVLQAYAFSGATAYTESKTTNFNFAGTQFKVFASNGIAVVWGGDSNTKSFDSIFNLNFDDCIFNIQTGNTIKLFNGVDTLKRNNLNIKINGGEIIVPKGYSLASVTLWSLDENDSIVFNPNANGEYTQLTLPVGQTAPTQAFPTDKGDMYYAGYNFELSAWLTVSARIYRLGNEQVNGKYIPYGCTAADYPFAVYVNGELYGLYDTWASKNTTSSGSPTAALEAAYIMLNGNDVTILLRDNYTVSGDSEYFENFGNRSDGTLTVDLGGNTLSLSNHKPLIILQAKNADTTTRTVSVTFKNGTMLTKKSAFVEISSYGTVSGTSTFNVTFTDVTFGYLSGATANSFFAATHGSGWNTTVVNFNFAFNNCTFDVKTNAPSTVKMIDFITKGGVEHTVTIAINGGKVIIGDSASVTLYTVPASAGSSCTFGKSAEKYTELYITSGDAPTGSFTTDAGAKVFVETGTEGGATVYTLGDKPVEPIVTPYGNIPGTTTLSTYAVFSGGNYIGTYATLAAAVEDAAKYTAQVQVLMFTDAKETATPNWTAVNDVVVDLNGKTLTYSGDASILKLSTSNTTTITYKNGALHANSTVFIYYGAVAGAENKTLNLNFENISAITNVADWQFLAQKVDIGVLVPIKLNVVCNNVSFNLNEGTWIFDVASRNVDTDKTVNSNMTANIQVNGGVVNMTKVLDDTLLRTVRTTGTVNFTLGKYNGEYIKLMVNTGNYVTSNSYNTVDGVRAFTQTGTEGSKSIYTIVISDIEVDGGTGGGFTDIQDAIDNTEAGGKVTINKDTDGGNITVYNAMTIDLNGKVLTVDGLAVFDKLTIIDSGVGTKGLIKTDKGSITIYEIKVTGGILVYNAERGGYEVASVTDQSQYTQAATNGFELIFRPSLDNSTAYNETILGAGGAAADIKILVNLEDADGNLIKGFEFDDSLVQKAYSEKLALKLTVRNIPSTYEVINVKYIISSGTGQYLVIDAAEYIP